MRPLFVCALCLACLVGCSKTAVESAVDPSDGQADSDGDADADGEDQDQDESDDEDDVDASDEEGDLDEQDLDEGDEDYELCNGTDDVRLAVVTSGGFVDSFFYFTNPYGHRFLYITGTCEFVTGESLIGEVSWGWLSDDEAARIERRLDLDAVNRWPYYEDEACPDAGLTYIQTASGYGECSCGCDPQGPEGLADTLVAAEEELDDLGRQGETLYGAVELIAIELDAEDPDRFAEYWPLAYDLSYVAIPLDEFYMGTEPQIVTFDEFNSDSSTLRDLRAVAGSSGAYPATYVQSNGVYYDVYIRDQLPWHLSEAIERF